MLSETQISDIVQDNYLKGSYVEQVTDNHITGLNERSKLFLEAQKNNSDSSVLEIGVYQGDTSLLWMELMLKNEIINPLLTVDIHLCPGYGDFYLKIMSLLTKKAQEIALATSLPYLWRHYPVSDITFMTGIYFDLPIEKLKKYFFINLDGPHIDSDIIKEINFFYSTLVPGGVMLVDDTRHYTPSGICMKDLAAKNGDRTEEVFNGFALIKRR